ncbi:MAG TPA: GTP-binding protein [Anaerolineae bacterium]|nr:GTP-binding protein [Anaerolineae bacterium]
MLRTVLDERQAELLREERRWLQELSLILAGFETAPEDLATLQKSILQLDELFLLVTVGEFNSGKSAFINALLGQRFLAEGVTPTTTRVHILKYGERAATEPKEEFVLVATCPVDFLREINIVDTPGTNAIIRRHEEITADFVPRSDLVLFVTSADRPFTESERLFLERIRNWGKKVVIVLNKIDILEGEADVEKVVGFITEHAQRLLGFAPEVFPLSAKLALQAKTTADGAQRDRLWEASRFAPLERYILETLDQESRIRLKLLNPLGVAERLASQYWEAVNERLGLLREDLETIDNIARQLDLYKEDMRRDFGFRLSDMENILYEMLSRGMDFFDNAVRLKHVFDLIDVERVRRGFERRVVADTPQRIEARVQELIDWLVDRDLRQWQAVMEYLDKRRAVRHEDVIGTPMEPFEYNRQALLDSVGRAAQEVVASYDKEAEAREIAESVRMAVAGTALMEVGAVGLGTLLTLILSSSVADFTGILAASVVAALGLFVIPARRRRAKADLRAKIEDMKGRLMTTMTAQFEREMERSLHRLEEAIAPYTRFVRAEREKLEQVEGKLKDALEALKVLRVRIAGS